MMEIKKCEIIEELRNINLHLVESVMNDDKLSISKNLILIKSLIKLYLKDERKNYQ